MNCMNEFSRISNRVVLTISDFPTVHKSETQKNSFMENIHDADVMANHTVIFLIEGCIG